MHKLVSKQFHECWISDVHENINIQMLLTRHDFYRHLIDRKKWLIWPQLYELAERNINADWILSATVQIVLLYSHKLKIVIPDVVVAFKTIVL